MFIEDQIREIVWDKALTKGRSEGRQEGMKIGKEEGKEETLTELAHHLIHNLGYTEEQAAEALKVPLDFFANLHQ